MNHTVILILGYGITWVGVLAFALARVFGFAAVFGFAVVFDFAVVFGFAVAISSRVQDSGQKSARKTGAEQAGAWAGVTAISNAIGTE